MKTITEFYPGDRYIYDFRLCTTEKGYAQVDTDQDASYYGTWASPDKRTIVNYCEGDLTVQIADTPEEFATALRDLKKWLDGFGYRFIGIDPGFDEALAAKFCDLGLADLLH